MISLGAVCGCASFASFQTAKTLEKGKVSASAGGGSSAEGIPFIDVAARVGVGNNLDIGLKYNTTIDELTLLMTDVKWQVETKNADLENAIGFGISPVFVTADVQYYEGIAFHFPFYISWNAGGKVKGYSNPRPWLYVNSGSTVFGVGNSLGLKIGRKFSVMPEWSIWVTSEGFVTNHFGFGIGLNVQ